MQPSNHFIGNLESPRRGPRAQLEHARAALDRYEELLDRRASLSLPHTDRYDCYGCQVMRTPDRLLVEVIGHAVAAVDALWCQVAELERCAVRSAAGGI